MASSVLASSITGSLSTAPWGTAPPVTALLGTGLLGTGLPDVALLVSALLLGLVWGSFLNQLVSRTPHRGTRAAPRGVTLWRPARSVCLACGRALPWCENLPVLSYLLLHGRCRGCGASIGRRTLVLELLVPLAAVLGAWGLARHGAPPGWWAWSAGAASCLVVLGAQLAEGRRVGWSLVCAALLLLASAALAA
jgi:prepilin signal peptidase PulO-like enzyme (type II secretory pathway)